MALVAAGEILDDPILSAKDDALQLVLNHLRHVGIFALDAETFGSEGSFEILKRILRLFGKRSLRQIVDIPSELLRFVEHRAGKKSFLLSPEQKALALVEFFADYAIPSDLLKTLALAESPACFQPELFPVLHKVLFRGASTGNALSTSLLRIRRARNRLNYLSTSKSNQEVRPRVASDGGEKEILWKCMSKGLVAIEK